MIVYIDESYPDNLDKVILGALFVGINEHKSLHSKIRKIKTKYKFYREIKYSQLVDKTRFIIAKKMISEFAETNNSFFRSSVIPYSATKLSNFYGQDTNQKRINIYTDSAKKLILGNLPKDTTSDIYFDEEDRIKKTKLFKRLKKARSAKGGKIRDVYFTQSSDESRCVLQVCDLLTGAIKQNLYPNLTVTSRLKREFSEFALNTFNIKDCSSSYWKRNSKQKNHKKHDKFYISYFEIPTKLY